MDLFGRPVSKITLYTINFYMHSMIPAIICEHHDPMICGIATVVNGVIGSWSAVCLYRIITDRPRIWLVAAYLGCQTLMYVNVGTNTAHI